MTLNDKSEVLHQVGEYEAGLEAAQQAQRLARKISNRLREAKAWAGIGLLLGDLNRADESIVAYTKALNMWLEQGNLISSLRARAGLARAFLAQGNLDQACVQVEEILPNLADSIKVISQSDGGVAIHLTCYRVLAAARDPRALDVLQAGYALVQDRANRIPDSTLRRSFLENIREVREIVTHVTHCLRQDALVPDHARHEMPVAEQRYRDGS
jgi:tetratricopeptide (TPR) repeat protein